MSNQSQYWVFTLNNPQSEPEEFLQIQKDNIEIQYAVFQEEKGENETLHFQGYIEFYTRKRMNGIKQQLNCRTIHLEPRKGSAKQARDYCMKTDTRTRGPFETGEFVQVTPGQSRIGKQVAEKILNGATADEILREYPEHYNKYRTNIKGSVCDVARQTQRDRLNDINYQRKKKTILLIGPTGCGKTSYFTEREIRKNNTGQVLCSTDGYWFDGYSGKEALLIDEFAGAANKWTLANLLRVIDKYNMEVPIKGGFINFDPLRKYITTNIHPRNWYDYTTREYHYAALERRFDYVVQWTGNGTMKTMKNPNPRSEEISCKQKKEAVEISRMALGADYVEDEEDKAIMNCKCEKCLHIFDDSESDTEKVEYHPGTLIRKIKPVTYRDDNERSWRAFWDTDNPGRSDFDFA